MSFKCTEGAINKMQSSTSREIIRGSSEVIDNLMNLVQCACANRALIQTSSRSSHRALCVGLIGKKLYENDRSIP